VTKSSDKLNIDQLAEMFGLPAFDDLQERNWEYVADAGAAAERAAIEDEDVTDRQAEKIREEAEQAAGDELYGNWYDAVERVAESLFNAHGLVLVAKPHKGRKTDRRPYEFKIAPEVSWADAADKLRETINGVGEFHFSSLREFLDSGLWTARQAVLEHLGSIRRYPEVYGGSSPQRIFEQSWR
jgi:hypothetical protein